MKTLYPEIEPFETGMLPVSGLHTIFYERVGNPNGIPVVFLHGGPGGGIMPLYRRFFDPAVFHIILFDQRGSGRSTPAYELKENTTWDLIDDIEKLREKFGIGKWYVFGGSWGSTLALAYAETHPDRCRGLILRGIFLTRPSPIFGSATATRSPKQSEAILSRPITSGSPAMTKMQGFRRRGPGAFGKAVPPNCTLTKTLWSIGKASMRRSRWPGSSAITL
jgi:pimeloyl-ACP methyl ester carboxylesterase